MDTGHAAAAEKVGPWIISGILASPMKAACLMWTEQDVVVITLFPANVEIIRLTCHVRMTHP